MLLATRCPHCKTVFRLQQAQLEAHGGLVRCGHCQQVFNAAESRIGEPESTGNAGSDPAPDEGTSRPAQAASVFVGEPPAGSPAHANFGAGDWEAWQPARGEHDPAPRQPEPAGSARKTAPATFFVPAVPRLPTLDAREPTLPRSAAATPAHDADDAREPRFSAGAEPLAATPPDVRAPSNDSAPFAVTRETRMPPSSRLGSLLGSFVGALVAAALAILLVAQLAWWQRETLMIYYPVTQRWFELACAPLGCTVAPPRAIDGLRVEPASLLQIDGPHVLELRVPLSNRYGVALAYPWIELTLYDATNHIMVKRALAPSDYVPPGTPIGAGLPAGQTQTMRVRIDKRGEPASHFLVRIFYP
ncbi:DUF3426 domain-containing protein [Burkholderia guangdongensis]|uniref:DUF3426 domain-containing protein n=1 Tax=Burkholderia guangdongensis TaxID=1792500 RepID=UPI0015CDFBF6|nr:DUF3426 domain-containing protein [Burkholderia guangdongensis]